MSDTRDMQIVLGMLEVVERNSRITQRQIASELGIALGLVNAYLRRCVRKGFIKIGTAPLNRYAYYLTPGGFAEKSRLTAEYLSISFKFFRSARCECLSLLDDCRCKGWRRVVLLGCSDLAEIAALSAIQAKVEVVAVVDDTVAGSSCAGYPVMSVSPTFDAILITDMRAPMKAVETGLAMVQAAGLGKGRVLVPRLLGIHLAWVEQGLASPDAAGDRQSGSSVEGTMDFGEAQDGIAARREPGREGENPAPPASAVGRLRA